MPNGRVTLPITWFNFALIVLEDFEEDDETYSSRAFGLHDRTASSNGYRGLPNYIKLGNMQKSSLVVKPLGVTVTLKYRANSA